MYTQPTPIPVDDKTFRKLVKDDCWLHDFTYPVHCYDKDRKPMYLRAGWRPCYKITEEQNAKAKRLYEKRRKEIVKGLVPGVIAFRAVGSKVDDGLDGAMGAYRMRTRFVDRKGEHFFLELDRVFSDKKNTFFVEACLSEEKEKDWNRRVEEICRYNKKSNFAKGYKPWPHQNYYLFRGEEIDKPFTRDNVMEFLNSHFDVKFNKVEVYPYIFHEDDAYCRSI